jgi:hypothetical protein
MILLLSITLVAVYAQFSHPWPKTAGFAEIICAILMVLMVGSLEIIAAQKKQFPLFLFRREMLILFVLTSILGIVGYSFSTASPSDFVRDFAPNCFYLIVPSLAYSVYCLNKIAASTLLFNILLSTAILVPSIFVSLRAFVESSIDLSLLGSTFFHEGQTYRQYDSLVTFAVAFAPFGIAYGLEQFLSREKFIDKLFSLWLLFITSLSSLFGFSTLVAINQRAPLLYSVVGFAILIISYTLARNLLSSLSYAKLYSLILLVVIGIVAVYSLPEILISVLDNFSMKNEATSLVDHKTIEFFAIISDPLLILPGGFGASYSNPAIGNVTLRFTHSAITYFYLKYGLLGLTFILYLVFLVSKKLGLPRLFYFLISRQMIFDIGVTWGFSACCITGFFLQPTYKTLSFCILIGLCLGYFQVIRKRFDQIPIPTS